jgi:hypothetical protein
LAIAPDYPLIRSNLEFELGELSKFLAAAKPVETEGAAYRAVGKLLRRLGICHLLGEADGATLADRLAASGRAYLAFLPRVRWTELKKPYELCASRADPFFDALAAGDVAGAVGIGRLSAPAWFDGDEYEEDFAYVRALMGILGDGKVPSPDLEQHLATLHRAAAESDEHRVALCDALHSGSQDALDDAFAAHAGARKAAVAEERKNPVVEPSWLATEAYVDVEALALIRLAILRGLRPPADLRFAPRAARMATLARVPEPGAWRLVAEG